MSERNGLPQGWVLTKLGNVITEFVGGGTPPTGVPQYWQGSIPWFTVKDMSGRRPADSIDHISEAALFNSSAKLVPTDTVIIATRISLGKVIRVPYSAAINQDLKALITGSGVDKGFLEYWVLSRAQLLQSLGSGTTVKGLRLETLSNLDFPLPPLEEQHRIVAAIEQQFTRLDAGVSTLRRVQAALKRYRAAVLKAAVEGKLTEAWRAQHPDVEPASALLSRILAERRARWEADQRAKGKDPAKVYYEEPAAPDTSQLSALPESWGWATTDQLAAPLAYSMAIGPFGSNLKVEDYRQEGVPLVFVRNIRSGNFKGPDTRYITPGKAEELRPHRVLPGDILITKMGDPPGDACVYPPGHSAAIITADCIKWTLSRLLPDARYFVSAVNSQVVREQVINITKGVAQMKVSLARFKSVGVPLPPSLEQEQIVAEVERRLSVVTELEVTVEANLKRAERLRQSILERAFSGQLVPQDTNDEPASTLLERIRNEREAQVKNGRTPPASRRTGSENGHRTTAESLPVDILATPPSEPVSQLATARQAPLWQRDPGDQ